MKWFAVILFITFCVYHALAVAETSRSKGTAAERKRETNRLWCQRNSVKARQRYLRRKQAMKKEDLEQYRKERREFAAAKKRREDESVREVTKYGVTINVQAAAALQESRDRKKESNRATHRKRVATDPAYKTIRALQRSVSRITAKQTKGDVEKELAEAQQKACASGHIDLEEAKAIVRKSRSHIAEMKTYESRTEDGASSSITHS
jgi:hypothetical protein